MAYNFLTQEHRVIIIIIITTILLYQRNFGRSILPAVEQNLAGCEFKDAREMKRIVARRVLTQDVSRCQQ